MQYLWTGKWPKHRIPQIGKLTVNGMLAEESICLQQGQTIMQKFP